MVSDTLPPSALFDAADTVVAQRIAQVKGVGEVDINGSEQPAVRVRVDPARLAQIGLSLDAVRQAASSPCQHADAGRRLRRPGPFRIDRRQQSRFRSGEFRPHRGGDPQRRRNPPRPT